MIRNFIAITFRAALRRKGFTLFNVLGLSIGLTASLLILEYVRDELSYDNFIENKENIYRVRYDRYRDGQLVFKSATTFPMIAPTFKSEFQEVENSCRLYMLYGGGVVRYHDISHKESNVFLADQSFLEMFSYPLIHGDRKTALVQPGTAIIEAKTARKYFGEESPVGKRIRFGNDQDYEITGVIQSPENSHLKFSFLFSYLTYPEFPGLTDGPRRNQWDVAWGWYDFYNYVQLRPGTDVAALEARFPAFTKKYGREGDEKNTVFSLQPITSIHLYSDLIQEARINGNGNSVHFLLIIAFFILVIAWVNYVNLATARASERAKEVGVRKSIGATRWNLATQFMIEACIINLLAVVAALFLVILLIPAFNELSDKNLSAALVLDSTFIYQMMALFIFGAFISGIYPGFVLSSYHPSSVLKGGSGASPVGMKLRKGLVILQFGASTALIAGTLIVYRQIQFMQHRDMGIDVGQTLVINGPDIVPSDSIYTSLYTTFKQDLLQRSSIRKMAGSSQVPGALVFSTRSAKRIGLDQEPSTVVMYRIHVDHDFFDVYENELIHGRGFKREFNDGRNVVLNRKAIADLGFASAEDAVGGLVNIGRDTLTVIGVIENYHQEGLKVDFRPMAFDLVAAPQQYFSVKVDERTIDETIEFVKTRYDALFPGNPFNYFVLDTFIQQQYKNDRQFGKIFGSFSLLAIFVASLGLFGLASFTTAKRTKEIGIRKVLGSSVPSIFVLLSKDFLKLVIVSNVIAVPLVWFSMNAWLDTFAFRIEVTLWIFVLSTVITVFISFLTVSYQSLKAALINPVKALRYE